MTPAWRQLVIQTATAGFKNVLPESSRVQMRELLKTDMSLSAIAREVGCSHDAVKRLCVREGLR